MNKKDKTVLAMSSLASLLLASSFSAGNVKAASDVPQNPRLWGQDRYETAAKVAQKGWTSSDYAIVASGEGYADALCAAPLAKAKNAPILLTQNNTLNQNALSELKRLNVKHVYIIGGEGVVSSAVEAQIKEIASDVTRLGGQDRYATSVSVAKALGSTQSKVVLASGEGYADALSAAPVAAIEGIPVLLTESNKLTSLTSNYIKSQSNITTTYVIGGYASVSDSTMNLVPGAKRIGGSDRYATNANVIDSFSSDFNFKNAYVALGDGPCGDEFADALTGAALASKDKAPLIITSANTLNSSTENIIKSKLNSQTTITILGGTANISDSLVNDIDKACGSNGQTPGGGGSSSGGSSGGGSSTNYGYNFTQDLSPIDIQKANDKLKAYNNDPNNKYATIEVTKSGVNVTLDNTSLKTNNLKEAFDAAKNGSDEKVNDYLNKANDELEAHSKAMSNITIGGQTPDKYIASMGLDEYVTADNGVLKLNVSNIKSKMNQDKGWSYEQFISAVEDKAEQYVKTTPNLNIKYDIINENIDEITKGGNTLYNTSSSDIKTNVGFIVKNLLGVDGSGMASGNYRLICHDGSGAKNYIDIIIK